MTSCARSIGAGPPRRPHYAPRGTLSFQGPRLGTAAAETCCCSGTLDFDRLSSRLASSRAARRRPPVPLRRVLPGAAVQGPSRHERWRGCVRENGSRSSTTSGATSCAATVINPDESGSHVRHPGRPISSPPLP
jgi:hypothetical protein